MQENEYELVVSQGQVPILRRLGAAMFLTFIIYAVYMMGRRLYEYEITEELIRSCGDFMKIIGFSIPMAIGLALSKTVLIDTDKNLLISRFSVGPFSHDYFRTVPKLEYVAVFKDDKERFRVNLWYNGNHHYEMYRFGEKQPAMLFARNVGRKLNLDLLDSTVKGDFKWVEKDS